MWDKSSTTKPQAEPFFSRIQNWKSGPDSGLANLAQWGSVNNMQISLFKHTINGLVTFLERGH